MATKNKTIKLQQRMNGRKFEYCIICEDCYDVAKRHTGWAVTKNGEFIDKYYYGTKWAAAEMIPNCQYAPAEK